MHLSNEIENLRSERDRLLELIRKTKVDPSDLARMCRESVMECVDDDSNPFLETFYTDK